MNEQTKHLVDTGAALGIAGTLLGWLPMMAAALGIIWYGMQIYSWVVNKKWKPEVSK